MDVKQEELFPPIGESEEKPDVEPDIEDSIEDTVDPVQDQLKEMRAELDEQRKENSRLNGQLLQVISRPAEQPQEPPLADEKLPDLLEDPEGYAATLERNIERKMEGKNKIAQQQNNQNARYDKLTTRFQLKEPDLAKENWDVVEFIVTKKVREAQANNISVDALVFADQDKFIEDVARDVKAMVGAKPEDEDDSDTQGLPSAGGISKRSRKKSTEKAPKSFAQSLKEIRSLTPGFHNPAAIIK